MKGIIIIGYQGIGKSSCAGIDGCIDLESSNFYIDDKRAWDWYKIYCEIAKDLASQGYTVFISSHKEVRDYLEGEDNVVVFCPPKRFKLDWIQRLQNRYDKDSSYKNLKALKNARERYSDNIRELMDSGFPVYQPDSLTYNLLDYVHQIREDLYCN